MPVRASRRARRPLRSVCGASQLQRMRRGFTRNDPHRVERRLHGRNTARHGCASGFRQRGMVRRTVRRCPHPQSLAKAQQAEALLPLSPFIGSYNEFPGLVKSIARRAVATGWSGLRESCRPSVQRVRGACSGRSRALPVGAPCCFTTREGRSAISTEASDALFNEPRQPRGDAAAALPYLAGKGE